MVRQSANPQHRPTESGNHYQQVVSVGFPGTGTNEREARTSAIRSPTSANELRITANEILKHVPPVMAVFEMTTNDQFI